MPTFTAPIRRYDTARGHVYKDAEGRRVPGVTTFLDGGVPKKALINWAATTTADYAVAHWDELGQLDVAARLKKLNGARWEEKDRAANKGTLVHELGEQLVAGQVVQPPDELAGYAEAYARFLDEFDVQPVYVESSVVSYEHGYAGTLDLIADLTHPRWGGTRRLLLDLKTNRSGIFGETALQLAGYRFADVLIVDEDGEQVEIDMPEVDGCAGVHVRADGYDLVPVTADEEQHRVLLYAREMAEFTRISSDLVGRPIAPPASSSYRLTLAEAG